MRQKSMGAKEPAEQVVRNIRRRTRKQFMTEEKIKVVLERLRGGIAESLYYSWSKEFLGAGKRRLAGDTAHQANTAEVRDRRREMRDMKEPVADLTLENRLLKKA